MLRHHGPPQHEIRSSGGLARILKAVTQTPSRLPKYQAGIHQNHDGMQMCLLRIYERRPQSIQPLHAVRTAPPDEVREAFVLNSSKSLFKII